MDTTSLLLSIFLSISIYCVATENNSNDVEGYYWREFQGDIPSDAFVGGKDSAENPIYIGQVYAFYIIPAKIYHNDKHAYYEYSGFEHKATTNIKILCTKHPEQFEWLQTSNEDIKNLKHKNLVIGGFEPTCTTYIGRIISDGELAVGKALAGHILPIFSGLYVTKNGRGKRYTTFEVLAYNNATFLNSIDIRFKNE